MNSKATVTTTTITSQSGVSGWAANWSISPFFHQLVRQQSAGRSPCIVMNPPSLRARDTQRERLLFLCFHWRFSAQQVYFQDSPNVKALFSGNHFTLVGIEIDIAMSRLCLECRLPNKILPTLLGSFVNQFEDIANPVQRLLSIFVPIMHFARPSAQIAPTVGHVAIPLASRFQRPIGLEKRDFGHFLPAISVQQQNHL